MHVCTHVWANTHAQQGKPADSHVHLNTENNIMIEMQQKENTQFCIKWEGNNMEEAHELTQRLETPRSKNWEKGDCRARTGMSQA